MCRSRTLCGLNPCSNGMKIEYGIWWSVGTCLSCLNPCSNGMKIECAFVGGEYCIDQVLILVLME